MARGNLISKTKLRGRSSDVKSKSQDSTYDGIQKDKNITVSEDDSNESYCRKKKNSTENIKSKKRKLEYHNSNERKKRRTEVSSEHCVEVQNAVSTCENNSNNYNVSTSSKRKKRKRNAVMSSPSENKDVFHFTNGILAKYRRILS